MSRILLTGAAGFIGFWCAKALTERGDDVVAIDNFSPYYDPKLKQDRAAQLKDKCPVQNIDITDTKKLETVFEQNTFDKVCHLAAQAGVRYSLENPIKYEMTNNLGTLNLLELCRKKKVPHFVYASSSSVYGGNKKIPFSVEDPVDKPISMYAATKRANELMAHSYSHLYGINCTGLRFFTVYGPWGRPDMALFKFTDAILKGKPIDVYNNGNMKRDFTYITDIVAGVLASLDNKFPYELFNLGNSQTVELTYFISVLEKELGKEAKKNLLPIQPGDVPETFADIEKSKKKLGFAPKVKIEEGIREFVQWYKSYCEIKV